MQQETQTFPKLLDGCTIFSKNFVHIDSVFFVKRIPPSSYGKNKEETAVKEEEKMKVKLFFPRTDLAAERHRADLSVKGVQYKKQVSGEIETERLRVSSEEGAKSIGKPCGLYVTVSFPPLPDCKTGTRSELTAIIAECLLDTVTRLSGKVRLQELSILAIGLGNRRMTPDSIGAEVADRIHATAHIRDADPALFEKMGCAAISVVAPGVLGDSGIEAADRVRALVSYVHPDVILVFDALAARSFSRVRCTVQIADTGISPGSGIGNRRRAISRATVGAPVIAIGVPTVTDTATLLYDMLARLPDTEERRECERLLADESGSFVSPSDCDAVIHNMSLLLAEAVNATFGVTLD